MIDITRQRAAALVAAGWFGMTVPVLGQWATPQTPVAQSVTPAPLSSGQTVTAPGGVSGQAAAPTMGGPSGQVLSLTPSPSGAAAAGPPGAASGQAGAAGMGPAAGAAGAAGAMPPAPGVQPAQPGLYPGAPGMGAAGMGAGGTAGMGAGGMGLGAGAAGMGAGGTAGTGAAGAPTGAPGAMGAAAAAGAGPVAGAGGAIGAGDASYVNMIGDLGPVFLPRASLLGNQFSSGISQQPIPSVGVLPGLGAQTGAGEQPIPLPPTPRPTPTPTPLPRPGQRGRGQFNRNQISPGNRGQKMADNMSPIPQDRIFFNYNFYSDVNQHLNEVFNSPLNHLQYDRYTFGFEKTFADGQGSFGLRLPIEYVTAQTRNPSQFAGGNSTAVGNLGIFTKYILAQDRETGSLLSVGMIVNPQTGPGSIAGASFLPAISSTSIQPFLGYFINRDRFFILGFASMEAPTNLDVPLMFYNDIGFYYFLYRANRFEERFLTAIVPVFEVHVNDPLNHRNVYSQVDLHGVPDIVDLTYGLNFELNRHSILTGAICTPVTGPRPYSFEVMALLNVRFGGRNRAPFFPIIGG